MTSKILKLTLAFLSSRFPTLLKKEGQKFKYLKNEKNVLGKIEISFIIFKGLSLKQIKPTFFEGESPILKTIVCMFKVGLSPSKRKPSNKNPLKMIKNIFYFILKALFVLKILKFLS